MIHFVHYQFFVAAFSYFIFSMMFSFICMYHKGGVMIAQVIALILTLLVAVVITILQSIG